ncbi:MAG: PTS sugar transporter subunit IIB [Deltaproteobacteria bacterium]|jgi:mannose/fructose/N-acetylgalactosamine-specific phosphotransferase system component IIB|nr:PTS sugar transporter subunit IIB [Deltaproteobacteria bacterium]
MPVTWARIDQKLIHGQVTAAWVPYLRIGEIVVIDDCVVGDDMTQAILASGVPAKVRTAFITAVEAAVFLAGRPDQNVRRMLIFRDVVTVKAALDFGLVLDSLNLGNLVYRPSCQSQKLSNCFHVNHRDLIILEELKAAGLRVFLQSVPGDLPKPFAPPFKPDLPDGEA